MSEKNFVANMYSHFPNDRETCRQAAGLPREGRENVCKILTMLTSELPARLARAGLTDC